MNINTSLPSRDRNMSTPSTADASAEMVPHQQNTQPTVTPAQKKRNLLLLVLYCTLVTVGSVGGPLLQRLYFTHGGTLPWFQGALPSAGFFILLPPLLFHYFKTKLSAKLFFLDFKLLCWGVCIGILIGLGNYLISVGISRLPVSTTSLLSSTTLAFTAFFSLILVKQKFTFFSTNAVVVITLGAVVLALNTGSDRPSGVSKEKYSVGFLLTLVGCGLGGLSAPLYQLAFTKTNKTIDYIITMQVVVVVNISSTMFAVVGMLVNKEFQAMPKEAKEFALGEAVYILIAIASAIMWQLSFFGVVGIIACTSSLFVGIFTSGLVPITQVASVITFGEKFTGQKGLSLALCLWGFTSYFMGEYKMSRGSQQIAQNTVEDSQFTEPNQIELFGNGDKDMIVAV